MGGEFWSVRLAGNANLRLIQKELYNEKENVYNECEKTTEHMQVTRHPKKKIKKGGV